MVPHRRRYLAAVAIGPFPTTHTRSVPHGTDRRLTNWWCYHHEPEVLTTMFHILLRWLAGRLVEAASQAVAHWMLYICNTEPSSP